MFNWIGESYASDATELYTSYDITFFIKSHDREVLQALAIILGQKIKIEANEAMIKMALNILEAHIYYDFFIFLFNEINMNLSKVVKDYFWHASYLWWLVIDQHSQFFIYRVLWLLPHTFTFSPTPIDIWVPLLIKRNGSYYEFMDKFIFYPWGLLSEG